MNLIRFAITVPLILGLGAAIAGCSDDDGGISGSGNIVTLNLGISGFKSVRLDLFSAEITQSETYSVTVRVDDNLVDRIDINTSGDALVLRPSSGTSFSGNVTLEATITMPTMESLELNGAASADLDGFGSLDTVELNLNGASNLTGVLTADRIQIDGLVSPRYLVGRRFRESLLARCKTPAEREKLADFMANASEREKTRFFMNLRANRVKVTDSPLHYRRRPPRSRYRRYRKLTFCFVWLDASGTAPWPEVSWAHSKIELQ